MRDHLSFDLTRCGAVAAEGAGKESRENVQKIRNEEMPDDFISAFNKIKTRS